MRSSIEALFDAMMWDGWATSSGGDVESPTGHYAIVINDEADLYELFLAFDDVINVYGEVSRADVAGNFIVTTDSQGFVNITRYDTKQQAWNEYNRIDKEYLHYCGDHSDCCDRGDYCI